MINELNIFQGVKTYGLWTVKSRRTLNAAEQAQVSEAYVVPSKYGLSVCFVMKSNGNRAFFPLSINSKLTEGQVVDPAKLDMLILEKAGEDDIIRVEETEA